MRQPASSAVFVGGGPAGLAGAIAARLAGLHAVVVERRRPPLHKACGEGIAPDGVELLEALGVHLPASACCPFDGIRFVDRDADAVALFADRTGLGVQRGVLHQALMRRAAEVGVHLRWGSSFRGLRPDGIDTDRGLVPADFIVAADGLSSAVRRGLGLARPPRHQRFGIRRHYDVAPWSRLVEVHWTEGCEFYLTPVGDNMVNVVLLTGDRNLRLHTALPRLPWLQKRLARAGNREDDRGAPTVLQRSSSVVNGNVALLGDASGAVDAITGAGVTLALRQAVALAAAMRDGDLRRYEAAHRRLMRWPDLLSTGMMAINRRRWLRWMTLRALQNAPPVFSGLLALSSRPPELPRFLAA